MPATVFLAGPAVLFLPEWTACHACEADGLTRALATRSVRVGAAGVDGPRACRQRRRTVATILIVDDDAFVRTLLKDVLEGRGHALLEAEDGREALDVLGERVPQLVLLDLFMPRLSGMEALALMRERWPSARVLVISSLDSERLVAQALEAGAAGYITKPFHPVEITSAVERALAN
jgi:two-component system, chemotaxis family, chemotaxis protein CheY